ncbi:hypothetical protein VNO78_20956 [Psophocarpus tetragonolobus]|uniref:Uncharacterized protein n=1 Tax=Psophocarpus tetragonolobus TaxID=3891 RepID=A0AAN9XHM7_PSOTE
MDSVNTTRLKSDSLKLELSDPLDSMIQSIWFCFNWWRNSRKLDFLPLLEVLQSLLYFNIACGEGRMLHSYADFTTVLAELPSGSIIINA